MLAHRLRRWSNISTALGKSVCLLSCCVNLQRVTWWVAPCSHYKISSCSGFSQRWIYLELTKEVMLQYNYNYILQLQLHIYTILGKIKVAWYRCNTPDNTSLKLYLGRFWDIPESTPPSQDLPPFLWFSEVSYDTGIYPSLPEDTPFSTNVYVRPSKNLSQPPRIYPPFQQIYMRPSQILPLTKTFMPFSIYIEKYPLVSMVHTIIF